MFTKDKFKYFLIISFYVLASLLFLGYRWGDGDQNSHIPFLLKTVDPTLYPNNSFIELRHSHYSYFWYLLAPIIKFTKIPVEVVFFGVYILVLYMLYASYYSLISCFVNKEKLKFTRLLIFLIPAFSFTIMPTVGDYLVNRLFALPFLVFSISLFLRGRYNLSFFLLGLAYNFHAISASFVLAMFLLSLIVNYKTERISAPGLIKSLLLFVLTSFPVLMWKFGDSGIDLSVNREWFDIVSEGVLPQVFFPFKLNPPTIILAILGIGDTLVFILLILKKIKTRITNIDRKLISFFVAVYLILLVGIISYHIYPFTTAVQFQLTRVGKFIPILSYPFFLGFIYERFVKKEIARKDFYLLLATVPLSGWLIPSYLVYFSVRKKLAFTKYVIFFSSILIMLVATVVVYRMGQWKPGIYVYPQTSTWSDVMLWARNNTRKDDLFITPVEKWDHYQSDFMVLSERSTVVTLGELMEIAFHPDYIDTWKERFEDVVPGAIGKFNGDFLENKRMTREIYNRNTTKDFMRIGEKYGADFVITEKPHYLNLKEAYENENYIVYSLTVW